MFENLSLLHEEDEELFFESDDVQNNDSLPEFCMVGRFLSDRPIPFNVMRNKWAELWRPVKGMSVTEI